MPFIIEKKQERGILIIEDDEDINDMVCEQLKEEGYRNIIQAYDGLDGLNILNSDNKSIYLIILDLGLPNVSGIEIMKNLSSSSVYPTGILILTARSKNRSLMEIYEVEGGNVMTFDYIEKPFSFKVVLEDVNRSLRLIHKSRKTILEQSSSNLHRSMDKIEENISKIKSDLNTIQVQSGEIRSTVTNIEKSSKSFIEEIGTEILKIAIIGLFIIGFLYFDSGDFIKSLLPSK